MDDVAFFRPRPNSGPGSFRRRGKEIYENRLKGEGEGGGPIARVGETSLRD